MADRAELRALSLPPEQAIEWLLEESHEKELTALLGADQLDSMRLLAKEANRFEPFRRASRSMESNQNSLDSPNRGLFQQTRAGVKQTLILPGILGSTLAHQGDTIWFDPVDIARGKLSELKLANNDGVESNGAFAPTYLRMFLQLWAAGLRPEYFHYDWRKPIGNAADLLVKRLRQAAQQRTPIVLAAHSMGGLVSRAALKKLGTEADAIVERTILLGTPNQGSFAPALVLSGDNSTVQWMNWLHSFGSSGDPIKEVFSGFIGLYQMLPGPDLFNTVDLFNTKSYPEGVANKDTLQRARNLQSQLIAGNPRIHMVVGTGFDTVVGLEPKNEIDPNTGKARNGFKLLNGEGDETVPRSMAMLPGADHFYFHAAHSKLPSNSTVLQAVIDLAFDGKTQALEKTPPVSSRSISSNQSRIAIDQLRRAQAEHRSPSDLSATELRSALTPFLGVDEATSSTTAAQPHSDVTQIAFSSEPITVGRKRQQRLDIHLALGDITQASGRAILVGVFSDVRPTGATLAIDQRIGGTIAEIMDRRMFSANLGEVFVLPTRRGALQAEMVVMVGLGSFSQFREQTVKLAIENAMRTMLHCQVDEIVTVLIGAGSALALDATVRAIFTGMLDAIRDSSSASSLRSLTLCHRDPVAFQQLQSEIRKLAFSSTMDEMEITIDVLRLPELSSADTVRGGSAPRPETTYLTVRQTLELDDKVAGKDAPTCRIDMSLLAAGSNATVLSRSIDLNRKDFESVLESIKQCTNEGNGFQELETHGLRLANLLLDDSMSESLKRLSPKSLTIINDAWTSRIPWEVLTIKDMPGSDKPWHAGLEGNVSRRYSTSNLSVAKWLRERRRADTLEVLLIVNPTSDLAGADKEGERIEEIVKGFKNQITLTKLMHEQANKRRLLSEIGSGKYDVIHYAGHAFFDPTNRSTSGILCSDRNIISGQDLSSLDRLPALAVFNACESGRVRSGMLPTMPTKLEQRAARIDDTKSKKGSSKKDVKVHPEDEVFLRNVSFAESFLRGGIASFVGTYWPVDDDAAKIFATEFYEKLLSGATIGASLQKVRMALHAIKKQDWANYIHYGDPEFRVKVL